MPEHKEAEEDKPMWWSIIQVGSLHLHTEPGVRCLQVPCHMCRVCKDMLSEHQTWCLQQPSAVGRICVVFRICVVLRAQEPAHACARV